MDSIKDLLKKKADKLDVENRLDELSVAQKVLDRHFDGHAKATKIVQNKLFVQVTSSSAASEVRLSQITVLEEISRDMPKPPNKLVIRQ